MFFGGGVSGFAVRHGSAALHRHSTGEQLFKEGIGCKL
jgi:hypothetical protein